MLTPEQQAASKVELADAFDGAAVQVLQVRDRSAVAALRRGADAKRAHLADVAIAAARMALRGEGVHHVSLDSGTLART